MAWAEPLAMNPCSSALPVPFLTLVFCTLSHSHYLLSLLPVFQGEWQEMCCMRELTPLGEKLCKRCRRTERVSLFLVSYISPWFSRAEPGTCCRESMSGLSMLQCRISGWGNPCRIVLVHSGNMRPECMRHCGNPLKAVSCFPSRPNLPFSGLISTIPSLYLEQSIYLLYFGQFRLFCCDRNLMGIKHSWWVSSPHRSQVLVPWDTLSP